MSIASEISRISEKVNDSFDAVVEKGGTVTSRKIADLPAAIGTISGGDTREILYYSVIYGTPTNAGVVQGLAFVDSLSVGCNLYYFPTNDLTNLTKYSTPCSGIETYTAGTKQYYRFKFVVGKATYSMSRIITDLPNPYDIHVGEI